jgi:hypothetical protein
MVRGVAAVTAGLDFSRERQPNTKGVHMDPNPDYDASDELEYGTAALAWLLRGVYPPPAYPPV